MRSTKSARAAVINIAPSLARIPSSLNVMSALKALQSFSLPVSRRQSLPLTAEHLAELAIESARRENDGRDGITYLMNAKRSGIVTPLSDSYEQEILRRTETYNLAGALHKIQRNSTLE